MKGRNRNELWANVLVDELIRNGVKQFIVAPGSRSTPLVLAAASRSESVIRVRIDERCAGFTALGMGKATGVPAAVITTSGTAVANLLPAVVEAAQSETPLLILSADRPPRLRGRDANQAIDQDRIFGRYPVFFQELSPAEVSDRTLRHLRSVVCQGVAASRAEGRRGPVHLNLPFEKPLEPTPVPDDPVGDLVEGKSLGVRGREGGRPFTVTHASPAHGPFGGGEGGVIARVLRWLKGADRPLVVAGPLPDPVQAGPVIRAFCAKGRIPLLADSLSGARFPAPLARDVSTTIAGPLQPPGVSAYDLALGSASLRQALRPDLILRLGRAPTSSRLTGWLLELGKDPDGPAQVVLDSGRWWKDHLAVAQEVIHMDPAPLLESVMAELWGNQEVAPSQAGSPRTDPVREDWVNAWSQVDARVSAWLHRGFEGGDRDLAEDPSLTGLEGRVIHELLPRLGTEDLLFVSSSMPVRDLDTFGLVCPAAVRILGNRGASGIDGILSSAAGAAVATGDRVVALVGDLAFLHDQGGLGALMEEGVQVVTIVINNDGGGIFHRLPVRRQEPHFTPLFATPHGVPISRLAQVHDLPFRQVELRGAERRLGAERAGGLAAGLEWALGLEGSGVLEVRTDREETTRLRAWVEDQVAKVL